MLPAYYDQIKIYYVGIPSYSEYAFQWVADYHFDDNFNKKMAEKLKEHESM